MPVAGAVGNEEATLVVPATGGAEAEEAVVPNAVVATGLAITAVPLGVFLGLTI